MAIVDGVVDADRIDAARAFAARWRSTSRSSVTSASSSSASSPRCASDIVAHNMRSFTGVELDDEHRRVAQRYRDAPRPGAARTLRRVARARPWARSGTVRRLLRRQRVRVPRRARVGQRGVHRAARLRARADGYDTSVQGELLVSTFTAGHASRRRHHRARAAGDHESGTWASRAERVRGFVHGQARRAEVLGRVGRGATARSATPSRPTGTSGRTSTSRSTRSARRMGVPPLDPADAADGALPRLVHTQRMKRRPRPAELRVTESTTSC